MLVSCKLETVSSQSRYRIQDSPAGDWVRGATELLCLAFLRKGNTRTQLRHIKERIVLRCHRIYSHECKHVGNLWGDLYHDLTQHHGSGQGVEYGVSLWKWFFLLRAWFSSFSVPTYHLGELVKRLMARESDGHLKSGFKINKKPNNVPLPSLTHTLKNKEDVLKLRAFSLWSDCHWRSVHWFFLDSM